MTPENEKEHAEQIVHEEAQSNCDICGKLAILYPMEYADDTELGLCKKCLGEEEAKADYEYERMKEEENG